MRVTILKRLVLQLHPLPFHPFPEGPKDRNISRSPSEIEAFNRECNFQASHPPIGRTPKGSYSPRGLETPFSEPPSGHPLLRTLVYCNTHGRPPSQNPSENPSPEPFSRTLPGTFSEPFLLRVSNWGLFFVLKFVRSRGEIASTVSKVLSDRKVLFKHKNGR